jgi:hypothetical protein
MIIEWQIIPEGLHVYRNYGDNNQPTPAGSHKNDDVKNNDTKKSRNIECYGIFK